MSEWEELTKDAGIREELFEDMKNLFEVRQSVTFSREDGVMTKVVIYQTELDPLDSGMIDTIREFRLLAAAVGYVEVLSPLILPAQPYSSRNMVLIQLGFETPPERNNSMHMDQEPTEA